MASEGGENVVSMPIDPKTMQEAEAAKDEANKAFKGARLIRSTPSCWADLPKQHSKQISLELLPRHAAPA